MIVQVKANGRAVAKPVWKVAFPRQSVSIAPMSASAMVAPLTLAMP
jgi:hypothetical protein